MRTLTRKTWRDIKVRKGQFIALVVLVSLGITSYVAFVSPYRNLEASAGAAVDQLLLADFTTHVVLRPGRRGRQGAEGARGRRRGGSPWSTPGSITATRGRRCG